MSRKTLILRTFLLFDIFYILKYTDHMHFNKKDLFTIPNIMSYFRILLVPVFVVIYLKALRENSVSGCIWALAIVALSGLTDVFDGRVARKLNQVTDLGKILDPIADKAMQFAMMFCVVVKYKYVYILIIIFGAKEIISLCFSSFLLAHNKNIGGAMWCGKICTVILYSVMLIFILPLDIKAPVPNILIGISAAFMLLAFIVYMSAYIKLLIQLRREQREAGSNSHDDN